MSCGALGGGGASAINDGANESPAFHFGCFRFVALLSLLREKEKDPVGSFVYFRSFFSTK